MQPIKRFTMYTQSTSVHPAQSKHHGPHPGILALIYILLLIASLAAFGILSQGAPYPRPFGVPGDAQHIYLDFPTAVRVGALLQIASTIPLGLFAAALTSKLRFLGANSTGVNIASFGGTAAAILLLFSGICGWVLSQPGVVGPDLSVMRSLQLLSFASGGMAFASTLGLMMAGISVPCLFGKWAPRWLCWTGILLAAIAQLSLLGFLFEPFVFLLPVVRFLSLVWMIGMGFVLQKRTSAAVLSR
jgi:hypothetical protein